MDTRSLLSGIAIGAVAASILDPGRGARRRARLRDKAVRATRVTGDAFETTMRDLTNRTRGFAAETRGWIEERAVDDARLLERLRARLGRVSSHPRAIDVAWSRSFLRSSGPPLGGGRRARRPLGHQRARAARFIRRGAGAAGQRAPGRTAAGSAAVTLGSRDPRARWCSGGGRRRSGDCL